MAAFIRITSASALAALAISAAANAQQALIKNYPDSPKVPDAMLNLSSSQIALGDSAAARKTLEELVSRHPQSDAAERARQRLPKLR